MSTTGNKKDPTPFWRTCTLREMTREQWESLCDGCGICCLHKRKDADTGEIFTTSIACRFLDIDEARCTVYNDPYIVPAECKTITPDNTEKLSWLPDTCAYRRVAEGRGLEWWHPLISGSPETVHTAGISVRNRAVSESHVHPDDVDYPITERMDTDESLP